MNKVNAMWKESGNSLQLDLEFSDFKEAFRFMTDVAELAEAHNHHPEWSNVYNRVSIKLTTHDAGNQVTEKDRKLALAIESLPACAQARST
jgi:4a-hydroxytetrahydrobiopterin dehydratase